MIGGEKAGWKRRRAPLLLLSGMTVLVAIAGALAVLGYRQFLADEGPLATNRQHPAPALVAASNPARGEIRLIGGDGSGDDVVDGEGINLRIQPPLGSAEMQIGLDPTFRTVPWQPVSEELTLATPDVGYQTIFGRFRRGVSDVSPVTTVGVLIDPTYEAAVASAGGLHEASWVRPLTPSAIVVRIEAGRIERGGVIAYDFDMPPAGDEVSGWFGSDEVERNGEPFGRRIHDEASLLRVFDRLVGRPLDANALSTEPWTLVPQAGGGGLQAVEIQRITRANGSGLGADGDEFTPLVHDVILRFDGVIAAETAYELVPPPDLVAPISFTVDPATTRSPAVHVNQNGYEPEDRLKIGYLAGYPGEPGATAAVYRADLGFRVFDTDDGGLDYEGVTVQRTGTGLLAGGEESGAAVYELNFSDLTEPGRYQACVESVGCSEPFDISESVWRDLAVATARAMYHQRSGIALGPPYTSVERPRPYHTDDGLVVNESGHRLLDEPAVPSPAGFAALAAAGTDVTVPTAWGGHFDAGDWDRRIEHLHYVRTAVELVDRYPDPFGDLSLQIPESENAIPDLLDEALWTLDLFLRLQHPDGAIPGGIEAAEHPLGDSTSWTDTLAVFTYAPDPFSSYLYAGVAAQTASVLAAYDADRAEVYLQSALAAMAWADDQPPEPAQRDVIQAHRSVAAIALYGATSDRRWHDVFVETTTLTDGVDGFLSCNERTRCDAGWLYLGVDEAATDPELRSIIEESFIATADEIVAAAESTAFGWTLENRFVPLVWGLGVGGAPKVTALLRAYQLTSEPRFLEAAQRSAAVSLGANPANVVYVTGVGRSPVQHPLIVDSVYGGLPVWAGTPVYGNHRLNELSDEAWVEEFVLGPAGVTPLPTELPYLWQWSDTGQVPMFNEFTVFQSHGQALYAYGLLAVLS
ncbi:MAG: glycoside hydrolase family 9 protein [Acidimicrobiales bacterium]